MVEIRKAVRRDKKLIEQMYLQEVEEHPKRAQTFAEQLVIRFQTLLAFEEGKLSGTLTWDIRGGLNDGVVEIIGLGVNEELRRRRIATILFSSFIEETSGFFEKNGHKLRVILLFMEYSNDIARKFYRKMGFQEQARISKLYPDDDGVIWTKHL